MKFIIIIEFSQVRKIKNFEITSSVNNFETKNKTRRKDK
jgi:hypothetical protein